MCSAAYEFDFSSWKNEVGETHCALVQPCFHIDFNVLPVRQLPVRGNCGCTSVLEEERSHSSLLVIISMSAGILSTEMGILKEDECWLTSLISSPL